MKKPKYCAYCGELLVERDKPNQILKEEVQAYDIFTGKKRKFLKCPYARRRSFGGPHTIFAKTYDPETSKYYWKEM